MQPLKKRSTTIHEDTRRMLAISRDAYAFCAYVHYRCADSRQKRAGWCCENKQELADFVGLTRPGLYKMAERLSEIGLLEISDSGDYRATPKWIGADSKCKQSLQDTVNKVDTDCKQSLHRTVNKVYTHNKVELDISKNKEEEKKNASLSSSTSKPENFSLEAEKEKKPPPVAPAPPTITVIDPDLPGVTIYDQMPVKQYPTQEPHGEWKRVNIPDELETLKTDAAIREAFSMGRKIPSANFPEYLEAFRLDVIGRGETYANVKQLRAHFLNWSGSRFEIAQRKATQPKPQTTNGQPAKIRQL